MAKLTLERATFLRRQVTQQDFPKLKTRVTSGPTRAEDLRGSILLRAELEPRSFGYQWTKIGPTPANAKKLRDIPGISNGDPVTWGHLEALGLAVPEEK